LAITLAVMARQKNRPSVWAAEHGASSPEPEEPAGANPGVRFRIHGRLGDELPEQLEEEVASARDHQIPELDDLKIRLAQATEIDVTDLWMRLRGQEIELSGTVDDDGERQQLEELVSRLTGKTIRSRLRPRNP
jgi:hypothetical protein